MNMLQIVRVVAVSLAMSVASAAWAEGEYEPVTFSLTNGTESVIDQFYASPPSTESWEQDILGVDVLAVGDTVEITINDSREDCNYDFKAIFEDGTELEHDGVSVCGGEEYVYQ